MERREAKAANLKTYRTERPCPSGHTGQRYTATGHCVTCVKDTNAEAYAARPTSPRRPAPIRVDMVLADEIMRRAIEDVGN